MKIVLACIFSVFATALIGADSVGPVSVKTDDAKKAEQRDAFLMKTGGFVANKSVSSGMVSIINAQDKVAYDKIAAVASDIEDALWFKVVATNDVVAGKGDVNAAVKRVGGNVSVVLMAVDDQTAIVNYPELKTCIVNIAFLGKDVGDDVLERRVKKEISRAVCFALQMPYAEKTGGVYDCIDSLDKLDKVYVDAISPEQRVNAGMYADRFGISGFKRTTYRKACELGIAEKPRNKYQQHVWDEVHAMPTEPVKIIYDAKKGE